MFPHTFSSHSPIYLGRAWGSCCMRDTGCLSVCRFINCSLCLGLSSRHGNTAPSLTSITGKYPSSSPSVMLSLPDTCSRLSPEGRLTRGWCTLAFPTSDWNVYTSIFCGWETWKYPNVREGFDVKASKCQYSTYKISTPFGPFLVILLLILPPKQVSSHHI